MNERDAFMKHIFKKMGFLLIAACLCLGAVSGGIGAVCANAAASTKNGWVKESAGYCYYQNGKKLTNRWMPSKSDKKYYIGADGVRKTGWYTIKSGKTYKSYYFNSNGVLQKNKTKTIDKTLVKKMDAAIKSAGVKTTSKVKTDAQKKKDLELIFNYLTYKKANGSGRYGYEGDRTITGAKDVNASVYAAYAKKMLTSKKGSCYHYAAAYAFMAKRATGYPVRVCYGKSNFLNKGNKQPHGWVEIKIGKTWYVYDPMGARSASTRKIKWCGQKRSAMEGKYYWTEKQVNVEL